MKYTNGEEFLNKLYTDMYKSEVVMHTAEKKDTKEEAIHKYLDRLEHAHDIAGLSEHKLDILKRFYYQKYIIKELPESYVEHQKKMARERGYGDIDVDDEMKKEMLNSVKEDQKKSLDTWIEYFVSNDSIYPMWFKNYAFQGMISLGIFDKEKSVFTKRTDKTTAPFIELNREVLSLVYDTIKSEIGENEVNEEYEKALKNGESFKKLYSYYLTKQNHKTNAEETDGIWIKYDRGSDYHILCDTLNGKNTGWCIAGEEMAKKYLKDGDFYIYYTKGEDLKYTEPRIAIRMQGYSIAEVRGVGPDQNIEPNMLKIANQKLDEFPDKEKYQKKVHDMELLTIIENKTNNNEQLTKEEIIFLYELGNIINGFGYQRDPRIKEIQEKRNAVNDLNYLFNKIKFVNGNVSLNSLKSAEGLVLPKIINGSLYLNSLETSKGLVLPKMINGELSLKSLKNVEGLVLPKKIKKFLHLDSLSSAEGLVLPKKMNCNIYLSNLKSAKGLVLPKELNGTLDLYNLTNVEGLVLPKIINGDLWLGGLTNSEGLVLPEFINGNFHLFVFENLVLPKKMKGNLDLSHLESANGLILPEFLDFGLDLSNLKDVEGLILPKIINGNLNLSNLKSAEGLVLPKKIYGSLNLSNLESAEGLILPEKIDRELNLSNLKSAKKLVLPKILNGELNLSSLTNANGLVLPEISDYTNLQHLKNVEGLVLPKKTNIFYMNNVKNADKLVLPEEINGYFNLAGLENVEEIILPKILNGELDLSNLKSAKLLVLTKELNGDIQLQQLRSVENLVIPQSLYDTDSKLEKIKICYTLENGKRTVLVKFDNITILTDEEYEQYYEEITKKQENNAKQI